jgi:hypothetical protein
MAADERLGSDPDALADLGDALQLIAAAFGDADAQPSAPERGVALPVRPPVDVADADAVAALERSTIPHLEALERLQAKLSTRAVAAKRGVRRARGRLAKHSTGDVNGAK